MKVSLRIRTLIVLGALFAVFASPAEALRVKVKAPHDVAVADVPVYESEPGGEAIMPPRMTDDRGIVNWDVPPKTKLTLHFGTNGVECPEARNVKPMESRTFTDPLNIELVVQQISLPEAEWDAQAWKRSVIDDQMSDKEIGIVQEINRHRQSNGLAPVTVTKRLNYVIGRHVLYMQANQVSFSGALSPHCNDEGYRTPSMIKYAGLRLTGGSVGEILGQAEVTAHTAKQLVNLWKRSAGHNSFLLRPDLETVGVAVSAGYFGVNGYSGRCVDMDESARDACELSLDANRTLGSGSRYRLVIHARKKGRKITRSGVRMLPGVCKRRCTRIVVTSRMSSIRAYRRFPYRPKMLRCYQRDTDLICRTSVRSRGAGIGALIKRHLRFISLNGIFVPHRVVVHLNVK